jgi:hypothetical protein
MHRRGRGKIFSHGHWLQVKQRRSEHQASTHYRPSFEKRSKNEKNPKKDGV